MPFVLQPGMSFCSVGERLLFLDVSGDRYFCLTPQAESAFARLIARVPLDTDDETALAALCRQGLLIETPTGAERDAVPAPCAPLPEPQSSVLTHAHYRSRKRHVLAAVSGLIGSRLALRWFGIERSLRGVARRKRRLAAAGRTDDTTLVVLARAFERSGLLVSPVDRCLTRSIALARASLDRGIAVDLVIGVKLNPFEPHCWVQSGDRVVNDWPDHVRSFTPILVI